MTCKKTSKSHGDSVFKPIAAGTFRDRIQIQRTVLSRGDGQGGYNEQWVDLATVWARIQTIRASSHANIEKFEEMQLKYQQHYNITLRWGIPEQIDTKCRAIYKFGSEIKVLAILSVVNRDMLNWEIDLYCREGGNVG